MEEFFVFAVLLGSIFYAVGFGVLSALAVKNKNRDQVSWFIIGFLFGLFGLVAALLVEKIAQPCPYCGNGVVAGYPICASCRSDIVWFDGKPFTPEQANQRVAAVRSATIDNVQRLIKEGQYDQSFQILLEYENRTNSLVSSDARIQQLKEKCRAQIASQNAGLQKGWPITITLWGLAGIACVLGFQWIKQSNPEPIRNSIDLALIPVPAGAFTMGEGIGVHPEVIKKPFHIVLMKSRRVSIRKSWDKILANLREPRIQ